MGGFKVFTGGSGAPPLASADVNAYLMQQAVAVFGNTTARDAAITGPVEGQCCYTQDTNTFWMYDGTAWRVTETSQNGVSSWSPIVVQYPDSPANGTSPPTSGTAGKPYAIQGGTAVATTGAGGSVQFNFPQNFPNGLLTVTFSPASSGWDAGSLTAYTAFHFTVNAKLNGAAVSSGESLRVMYLAIGF